MFSVVQSLSSFAIPGALDSSTKHVVVFVHGIFSDHSVFLNLAHKLTIRGLTTPTHRFAYFDYPFRKSIASNGLLLAEQLKDTFAGTDVNVTIVGHSMGGLVGRLALLQKGEVLPFVKRLVMLGTPNHGTLQVGRMGILAQTFREATGQVAVYVTGGPGIVELTEIENIIRDNYLTADHLKRTTDIEYVTIAATCFHESIGMLKLLKNEAARSIVSPTMAMELLLAHPWIFIGLEKPHDGIVEAASVYLGNAKEEDTRDSERRQTAQGIPGKGAYVHIGHRKLDVESHVTIQCCDITAEILAEILLSDSIRKWREAREGDGEFRFRPDRPQFQSAHPNVLNEGFSLPPDGKQQQP